MFSVELKKRSLWQDAISRFVKNKAAVISLITISIILSFSFIGPYFSEWNNEEIDWIVLGDIATLGYPSIETGHFFGTDELGRDLYSRVIQGTKISLMVGVVGALIAVVVGTLYGAIAGYFGGRIDSIMMRLVDILMSIPYMFVLILLLVIFGRSIFMLFVGIGLISWLDMSRIVRGQTLSIKKKEFILLFICKITKHSAETLIKHYKSRVGNTSLFLRRCLGTRFSFSIGSLEVIKLQIWGHWGKTCFSTLDFLKIHIFFIRISKKLSYLMFRWSYEVV